MVAATDNMNIDDDAILDNDKIDVAEENRTASAADTTDFQAFNTVLQGTWKRVDYPNGTIEFANNRVKLTAGEGAAEPAKFEDFKVSDTCPNSIEAEASALAYDFLVIADKRCEAIKINGNKLTLDYFGTSKGIVYERMGKPSAAANAALNTIPSNFYGRWANEKANCASDNPSRIEITANKIIFFENESQLLGIKQLEPTRIEADFDYPDNKANRKPYFNTLDLQNNSKELIIRENGAAPLKNIKCE